MTANINLEDYFRIGRTSEDVPTEEPALINTIRVAPESTSTLHNSVKFKFENVGNLTSDSGVVIQPTLSSTATASNVALNIANGVLGSVKRCQLLIDGQTLNDLENPSYLETQRMYSRNTPARLMDYHKNLLGNDLLLDVSDDGNDELSGGSSIKLSSTNNFVTERANISSTQANNKKYFVPLHMLGLSFLRHSNLPLYLMKDRNIELILDFEKDCRQYAFAGTGTLNDSDVSIALDTCELVQTNILIDQSLQDEQMDFMRKGNNIDYTLIENYAIKRSITTSAAVGSEKNQGAIRLNVQNRELHRVLVVSRDVAPDGTNPLANQASLSLGDETYNFKSNGTFMYDQDINNDAVAFYLNSIYNNGFSSKISNYQWVASTLGNSQYTDSDNNQFFAGKFHYVGQSFRNGQVGVVGAGTGMRTPLEYNLKATPAKTANPDQTSKEIELNFYIGSTKTLTITPSSVMIQF